MSINWDLIERAASPNAAAVKAAKALPAKFPTPWDKPKQMPTISDVDFSKVDVQSLPIKSLLASNKNLKGPKVVWHVQHPGQRVNANPFTEKPLIMANDEGNIIVDGHHFLYAQQLLGQTKADCYVCPSK